MSEKFFVFRCSSERSVLVGGAELDRLHVGGVAAVDEPVRACHVGGVVARQQQDHRRHLRAGAIALEDRRVEHPVVDL